MTLVLLPTYFYAYKLLSTATHLILILIIANLTPHLQPCCKYVLFHLYIIFNVPFLSPLICAIYLVS